MLPIATPFVVRLVWKVRYGSRDDHTKRMRPFSRYSRVASAVALAVRHTRISAHRALGGSSRLG